MCHRRCPQVVARFSVVAHRARGVRCAARRPVRSRPGPPPGVSVSPRGSAVQRGRDTWCSCAVRDLLRPVAKYVRRTRSRSSPGSRSSPASSRSANDCTCGSSRNSRTRPRRWTSLSRTTGGRSRAAASSATASATCRASRRPAGTSSKEARAAAAATMTGFVGGFGAQPGREVRGERLGVLVAGQAEQHGGRGGGQFARDAGQAQQPQRPVERGGPVSAHHERHERAPVDRQSGGAGAGQQVPGRYGATDQVGEQAQRGLPFPGAVGAAEHAVQDERLGGPVGEQPPGLGVAAVAAQHEPAPGLAPPAEFRADPAVALAAPDLGGQCAPSRGARRRRRTAPLPCRGRGARGW
ncbi:hypothetical protein SALBM217S_06846 [Streptomyces griseoloalbus]